MAESKDNQKNQEQTPNRSSMDQEVKKIVTTDDMRTACVMATRRFNYLAKRLKSGKPSAPTDYWDTVNSKINEMLQQLQEFFRLDQLAHIEIEDIGKLFHDLRERLDKDIDAETARVDLKEDEQNLIKMFWKAEARNFFDELFEWMQLKFEGTLKKFQEKFYIEEDAINFLHDKAKEYFQEMF